MSVPILCGWKRLVRKRKDALTGILVVHKVCSHPDRKYASDYKCEATERMAMEQVSSLTCLTIRTTSGSLPRQTPTGYAEESNMNKFGMQQFSRLA